MRNLFSGKISLIERINFTRHLSITIRSGMPLVDGLQLIRKQRGSKAFKRMLDHLISDISNGKFLAQSFKRYESEFGDFFINVIRVGELSGSLAANLQYLSEELQKQKELRGRIRDASIYPFIIFCTTLVITTFLVSFVLPKVLPNLAALGVSLPWPTKLVLSVFEFTKRYGIFMLLGIFLLGWCLKALLFFAPIHLVFDRFMLGIPLISRLVKSITILNFTRSLRMLLKSGLSILDALLIAATTFHNRFYRIHMGRIAERVKRGEQIAVYLGAYPNLFPPMFASMIEIGENTGNLEENLGYLAEYYETEVSETLRTFISVFEPLLLLFMGLFVGFMVVSLILPFLTITQGFR